MLLISASSCSILGPVIVIKGRNLGYRMMMWHPRVEEESWTNVRYSFGLLILPRPLLLVGLIAVWYGI